MTELIVLIGLQLCVWLHNRPVLAQTFPPSRMLFEKYAVENPAFRAKPQFKQQFCF